MQSPRLQLDYNVNKYMHKIIELYQIINLHVSKY